MTLSQTPESDEEGDIFSPFSSAFASDPKSASFSFWIGTPLFRPKLRPCWRTLYTLTLTLLALSAGRNYWTSVRNSSLECNAVSAHAHQHRRTPVIVVSLPRCWLIVLASALSWDVNNWTYCWQCNSITLMDICIFSLINIFALINRHFR